VVNIKYTLSWLDATLQDNYKSKKDLIKNKLTDGIVLRNVTLSPDGWFDMLCIHEFKANNDKNAIKYIKNFIENYSRIDVFTVKNNNDFIFTEEDLIAE